MNRRHFLQLSGSGLLLWKTPILAAQAAAKNKKIVWLILRGAMDSLHALVPSFDKHLLQHRGELVSAINKPLLPVDRGFGLHPDLAFLHSLYQRKEFSAIVATASPYRSRSHFDGQDLLESGLTPTDADNGWLARALSEYHTQGLALAQSVPITLRGTRAVHTWYPSLLPAANEDLYTRLAGLYAEDPALQMRLQQAVETKTMVGDMASARRPKLPDIAAACAKLLRENNSLGCAMMEMGGWDTHNNLVRRLSDQFSELDAAIKTLHDGLGDEWHNTLVIIATEFGRTVRVNGTSGTDHGTASALFFAGGALTTNHTIKGGKVLGDWPGLAPEQLFEGRDLMPTSNNFNWISRALQEHWQLSSAQIAKVFPVR